MTSRGAPRRWWRRIAAAAVAGALAGAVGPGSAAQNLSDDPVPLLVDGLTNAALGKHEQAIRDLKGALAAGAKATAELLFWLGLSQVKGGEVDQGLANLQKSTAEGDPARIRHARLLAGEAHRKRSDCARAVPEFLTVRDSDPKLTDPATRMALAYLADCYLRLGRFDAAEATARMAETVFREDGDKTEQGFATRLRAVALLGLGDAAQALALLRRVPALNPDYALEDDLPAFFTVQGRPDKAFDTLVLQGYLGAGLSSPKGGGARIDTVAPGGPAAAAGLAAGDHVVAINGVPVADARIFARGVRQAGPGTRLDLRADRLGAPVEVAVVLGSRLDAGFHHRQVPDLFKWHLPRHLAVTSAERAELAGDLHSAFLTYWQLVKAQPPDSRVLERLIRLAGAVTPQPVVPVKVHALARQAMDRFAQAKTTAEADGAITDMENALRWAPWWPIAHLNLGLMHMARGNPGQAAVFLRLFLKADPQAGERLQVEQRIATLEAKLRNPRQ